MFIYTYIYIYIHTCTRAKQLKLRPATEGSFKSDSITTINVVKDMITKEATSRKINLSINVDVKDAVEGCHYAQSPY